MTVHFGFDSMISIRLIVLKMEATMFSSGHLVNYQRQQMMLLYHLKEPSQVLSSSTIPIVPSSTMTSLMTYSALMKRLLLIKRVFDVKHIKVPLEVILLDHGFLFQFDQKLIWILSKFSLTPIPTDVLTGTRCGWVSQMIMMVLVVH